MILYQIDSLGVYVDSYEIADDAPIPANAVLTAPPELSKGQYAQYNRGAYEWSVIDSYPTPTAPTITTDQVDAERNRRIDDGIEFEGVRYQTRQTEVHTDRENIAGMAQLAFMAIVGGAVEGDLRWANPDEDFAWIAEDNSLVPMDAPTVVAFGKAAAARKLQLIQAARALKDMDPIPVDYTDDKWWP